MANARPRTDSERFTLPYRPLGDVDMPEGWTQGNLLRAVRRELDDHGVPLDTAEDRVRYWVAATLRRIGGAPLPEERPDIRDAIVAYELEFAEHVQSTTVAGHHGWLAEHIVTQLEHRGHDRAEALDVLDSVRGGKLTALRLQFSKKADRLVSLVELIIEERAR